MRDAFVRHFECSYTRATTIEDLERCVQGPRESTRSWVQRWQELWYNAVGIHPEPRSTASRPRAATSPWSPSSNERTAHSTTYRISWRSPKGTRRKNQTKKPTTSQEDNAVRPATTTEDDPIYATATVASPASAAVTGESTSSPTLD